MPAVAITGHANPDDVAHSVDCGFDEHLSKPVPRAELIARIARLAGRGPTP